MRPAPFYERLDIYQKYLSYNHAESVQKENMRVEKRNYFFNILTLLSNPDIIYVIIYFYITIIKSFSRAIITRQCC